MNTVSTPSASHACRTCFQKPSWKLSPLGSPPALQILHSHLSFLSFSQNAIGPQPFPSATNDFILPASQAINLYVMPDPSPSFIPTSNPLGNLISSVSKIHPESDFPPPLLPPGPAAIISAWISVPASSQSLACLLTVYSQHSSQGPYLNIAAHLRPCSFSQSSYYLSDLSLVMPPLPFHSL